MADKIYVGSGKKKEFGNGGSILNLNLCVSDIPKEWIKKYEGNGKSYLRLKAVQKREPDQYGNTHYIEVDTWVPEEKPKQETKPQGFEENIPF